MIGSLSSSKIEIFNSIYKSKNKRKRNFSFNSSHSPIIEYKPKDKNFFLLKKDILISLLNNVKNSQIRFLSNKANDKKNLSKKILNNLIKGLTDNLREKENIRKEIEDNNIISKDFLYKEIFEKVINNKFEDKNISKNEQMTKLHNMNVELRHLKILNFMIENQIKSINNEIRLKIFEYKYLKNVGFMKEINREKKCEHKNDIIETSKLLNQQLNRSRRKFVDLVCRKNIQNEEIISVTKNIESIKKKIFFSNKKGTKRYIDSNEVIPELSNDNSKQYNFSENKNQINNIISIINNNKIININILNEEYKFDGEKDFEDEGILKVRKVLFIKNNINKVKIKNLKKNKMNKYHLCFLQFEFSIKIFVLNVNKYYYK